MSLLDEDQLGGEINKNSKTAAQIIAESEPISADFAIIVSFSDEQNKEKITEEILGILETLSNDARELKTKAGNISILLIGNGLFDKITRNIDASKIYSCVKDILNRYVDDDSIKVELYYSIDFYDNDENSILVASRCIFTQKVSKLNLLDESFGVILSNKYKVNKELEKTIIGLW